MSGYRVTFDASHKVKQGGHGQSFLQHVARDIDLANGVVVAHANQNIDASRTHLNETTIPDGNGGWVRPANVEQIADRVAARLATVKKPPRADAVIMRPIVCNLSPEWFAEHNPDWRENGLNTAARAAYDAMRAQAVEEFGWDNIAACSLHLDESLPQLQIAVLPVTDDGRLSQKDFYPNPASLRARGVRFREAVAATGIEVEMKPSPRSREHLSGDEFQRQADRLKEGLEDVEATEATLDVRAASLDARAANLDAREAEVNRRDEATRRDRRTLNAEIRRHNEQDAALKVRAADVAAREAAVETAQKRAEDAQLAGWDAGFESAKAAVAAGAQAWVEHGKDVARNKALQQFQDEVRGKDRQGGD